MTVSLRENAARQAGRVPLPAEDEAMARLASMELPDDAPDIEIDDTFDASSEKLSAIQAWLQVRRDMRAIGKNEKYDAAGTRYNFRGVETAVNAFSPITLRHGVNVIPFKKVAEYFETTTKNGGRQCDCRVTVTWHIYGPQGDFFVAESCGQALDTQDKGSAKAQSVALRVLLYEAGMIPTKDMDPEYGAHDRGEARQRAPHDYFAELLRKDTSRERYQQIRRELLNLRMQREVINNEEGEPEELVAALDRLGKARFAPAATSAKPSNSGLEAIARRADSLGHVGHPDDVFLKDCAACRMESAEMERAAAAES